MRGGGHHVGTWVFCSDFATDDTGALLAAEIMTWPRQPDFVVYDPENNYKRNGDAGDGFWRAAALVEAHNHLLAGVPAGVLLPGKADTEMDLSTFLLAGWPVFAMCYDAFKPGDELSYLSHFWPPSQIHPVVRTLHPERGQSIYRPEGLDP